MVSIALLQVYLKTKMVTGTPITTELKELVVMGVLLFKGSREHKETLNKNQNIVIFSCVYMSGLV